MWRSKENWQSLALWLSIGGLTALAVPFLRWLNLPEVPNLQVLLLIFSFPHFMQTYFLFYRKKELWLQHKLVAIYAPIALIVIIALLKGQRESELILLHSAMVLFFWHISRQAFGVAWYFVKPEFRSKELRYLVLGTALIFAVSGWLHLNSNPNSVYVFKSYLDTLKISDIYYQIVQLLAWFVLAGTVFMLFLRQRRGSTLDSRGFLFSITPLFALAAWVHPLSLIGAFGLIPVFHGIQYLGFAVMSLEMTALLASVSLVICGIVGWGVFMLLPTLIIDSGIDAAWLVSGIYVFLNIHHFFIDSVIWKSKKMSALKFK